jgi:hypothetical protein
MGSTSLYSSRSQVEISAWNEFFVGFLPPGIYQSSTLKSPPMVSPPYRGDGV